MKKKKEMKPKKKSGCLSKILIGMVVLIVLSVFFGDDENSPNRTDSENAIESLSTAVSESDLQEHDSKSDNSKDAEPLDFNVSFSKSYRNDVTGNWRLANIAEQIDIEKYALQYYQNYFESDQEVHIIINFTLKTTTRITVIGNMLDVSIMEYVDKEEHDAKVACSGELLKEYFVNIDTGEIEEIR